MAAIRRSLSSPIATYGAEIMIGAVKNTTDSKSFLGWSMQMIRRLTVNFLFCGFVCQFQLAPSCIDLSLGVVLWISFISMVNLNSLNLTAQVSGQESNWRWRRERQSLNMSIASDLVGVPCN